MIYEQGKEEIKGNCVFSNIYIAAKISIFLVSIVHILSESVIFLVVSFYFASFYVFGFEYQSTYSYDVRMSPDSLN